MTIKTTKRLEELCSYRDEISRRLEELRMRYTKVLNSIDNEKLVIFQDQNVLPTEWEFVELDNSDGVILRARNPNCRPSNKQRWEEIERFFNVAGSCWSIPITPEPPGFAVILSGNDGEYKLTIPMCRIEWFVKELGITTDLSNLERAKLKRMDTLATLEKVYRSVR